MERKGGYFFQTGLMVFILLISVIGATFSFYGAVNKNTKGETLVYPTGGFITLDAPKINVGNFNAGETIFSDTFTLSGDKTDAGNLFYDIILKIDNNTYPEGSLVYTISTVDHTNGSPIPTSTAPVTIPSDISELKIGSGAFAGPVSNGVHSYKLTITRSSDVETQVGEYSFTGKLAGAIGSN